MGQIQILSEIKAKLSKDSYFHKNLGERLDYLERVRKAFTVVQPDLLREIFNIHV